MKNSIGIIPVFVSHLGCPNDCTFCNQRKISGVSEILLPDAVPAFVMSYLETMKRDQIELAFFGGSFTGIEISKQIAYLEIAADLKEKGLIHKIRISTRPDYIDVQVIKTLKKYHVDLVELGCQSFDSDVLKRAKRGHDTVSIFSAVHLLREAEIDFGIQLMLGLPTDNYEKFKMSVAETIALNPSCVRLYPALVIRDTELETDFNEGNYQPLLLNDAIKWSAFALKAFYQHKISVIRMGLQRTDMIDFDASVIAGPFHPAFGEMVISELFYDTLAVLITDIMHNQANQNIEKLLIKVNPKQRSAAIGNKKCNHNSVVALLDRLQNSNDVRSFLVTFVGDVGIEMNDCEVVVNNQSYKSNIMK